MDIEAKREFAVTLKLTEREAMWLKRLMQNPLSEDEDKETSEMRVMFWSALETVRL